MFRPAGFIIGKVKDRAQLDALLAKGPVYLMSQTPVPPQLPGTNATLLYSEFPLARFGYGQMGADYITGYTTFAARNRFLKLLPLYWYTLYRVERSATIRP
jgi:phosphatidylinositol glycan class B